MEMTHLLEMLIIMFLPKEREKCRKIRVHISPRVLSPYSNTTGITLKISVLLACLSFRCYHLLTTFTCTAYSK